MGDFIVLSPRNHIVIPTGEIPTGTSDPVSYGGDYDVGTNIYHTELEIFPPPDIDADEFTSNITEKETSSGFAGVDTDADTLDIGGGATVEFGAGWYDASQSIGGDNDFCQVGACEFRRGIRAFFVLEFNFQRQGDGLTFSLIGVGDDPNNPINTVNSVGGDSELSELLAYAGDSRLNASGSSFLDGSGEGLEPPKMAVEFDTRTNNDTLAYCASANTADTDTRNDPFANNRDAVQFVYWGGKKLDIPCRDDSPTYDDNRHGCPTFPNWNFTTGDDVKSSPAIGADCTIYFGSNDNSVYALNPDGTAQTGSWPFVTGDDVVSSPAVAADGTIYVGSNDGHLYAINPDGSERWRYPSSGNIGAVRSSPAIGADGTIYVGSDDGNLYAINPNGTARPAPWPFVTAGAVRSSPAIGDDGTIYVGSDDFNVYAINPDGTAKPAPWPFVTGGEISMGRPAIGPDDTIHVAANDATLYAINPDGSPKWTFNLTDNNDAAPGIDPNDGTVYSDIFGSSLVAIRPNGTEKWRTNVGSDIDSTPAVGPDGNIYFGTDTARLYALEPVNGNVIWQFPTGGDVDTNPAVTLLGSVVYAGSDDNRLYAVLNEDPAFNGDPNLNPVSLAPQIKDLSLTSGDLDASVTVDDANNWLNGDSVKRQWAVRLEVDRSLVVNAENKFVYELRLWIRQCQNFDCSDIVGTLFEVTRWKYDFSPVATLPLTQQIELIQSDHDDFGRFLFGFTGAAGSEALDATISYFQLSFVRPGDPIATNDPGWVP
jgi:outer membrane protein assembly factor BamB